MSAATDGVTFPRRITVATDAPPYCPAWCPPDAHSLLYARDFPELEDRERYDTARRLFQAHHREIAEVHLDGLTDGKNVMRTAGGSWDLFVRDESDFPHVGLQVTEIHVDPARLVRADLELTSGEARSLAAQLTRAADLIDLDGHR